MPGLKYINSLFIAAYHYNDVFGFFFPCSWDCPSPSTVETIGGVHGMLSMPEYGFIAIPRDSVLCIPNPGGSNKFGASFETPFGNRMVKYSCSSMPAEICNI